MLKKTIFGSGAFLLAACLYHLSTPVGLLDEKLAASLVEDQGTGMVSPVPLCKPISGATPDSEVGYGHSQCNQPVDLAAVLHSTMRIACRSFVALMQAPNVTALNRQVIALDGDVIGEIVIVNQVEQGNPIGWKFVIKFKVNQGAQVPQGQEGVKGHAIKLPNGRWNHVTAPWHTNWKWDGNGPFQDEDGYYWIEVEIVNPAENGGDAGNWAF